MPNVESRRASPKRSDKKLVLVAALMCSLAQVTKSEAGTLSFSGALRGLGGCPFQGAVFPAPMSLDQRDIHMDTPYASLDCGAFATVGLFGGIASVSTTQSPGLENGVPGSGLQVESVDHWQFIIPPAFIQYIWILNAELAVTGPGNAGLIFDVFPTLDSSIRLFELNLTAGSRTVNETLTFIAPVEFGQATVTHRLNVKAGCAAYLGACTAMTDAIHSVQLQSVQFFDANMSPISGISVTTDDGQPYPYIQNMPADPVPVPEPASLVLLASGVAGVIAKRRWRVKHQKPRGRFGRNKLADVVG